MGEWRLFEEGTVPEWTTPEWYDERESAPHIDQELHRPRLEMAARFVNDLSFPGSSVVDLGCGDGGFLTLLNPSLPAWGYDLQQSNVTASILRNVDVRFGDCVNGEIEWGDVAVATEMLEHLIDPHAYVRKIAEHSPHLVASSPWNERPGSAYEFHTWAWDVEGYAALIEQAGYRILNHQTTGIFQVLSATWS